MSLLKEIENERLGVFGKKKKEAEEKQEDAMVISSTEFMNIARQVYTRNCIDKKTYSKMKNHRFRLHSFNWHFTSLIGSITAANFEETCQRSIEAGLKTIRHSQGNGDWKLAEYEVATDKDRDNNELLVIAARYIDVLNKEDLQYVNGIPAPNVNVNVKSPAIPKEVLSALGERGTDDDELKVLLKQLITVMASDATPTTDTKTLPQGEEGVEMT